MGNLIAARVQRLAELARSRYRAPAPEWAEHLRRAAHSLLAAGCAPEDAAGIVRRLDAGALTAADRQVISAVDADAVQACGSTTEFLRLVASVEALT